MPQQRFRRPRWARPRTPSPPPPPDEAPQPNQDYGGLPPWIGIWVRSRRSMGTLCFSMGVIAHVFGLWQPIEDFIIQMVPFALEESGNQMSIKFVIGPTMIVIVSSLFASTSQTEGSFNTAQLNGINAACGSFVGMHMLNALGQARAVEMLSAVCMIPATLSFLSTFLGHEKAWLSPIMTTGVVGGACTLTWVSVIIRAGFEHSLMLELDFSIFTLGAAMAEHYVRKAVLRSWGEPIPILQLVSEMLTDVAFSWIMCTDFIELIAGYERQMSATDGDKNALGVQCTRACRIIRVTDVIVVIAVFGHSLMCMRNYLREKKRLFCLLGAGTLLLIVMYLSVRGPFQFFGYGAGVESTVEIR